MEISKWRNEWINAWVNKNKAKIWLGKKDLHGLKKQGMVFVLVFTENLQYWIVDTTAQKCCNSLDTSKGMHRHTNCTLKLRRSSLTQQAHHIYLFRFSHIEIICCFVMDKVSALCLKAKMINPFLVWGPASGVWHTYSLSFLWKAVHRK